MKLCKKCYVATGLLIMLIMAVSVELLGQTGRGLHFTPEEVQIWKQRAISGPYKNDGDVSSNSPGDWARIQRQANEFLANPSAERWYGGDGSYQNEPHKNHLKLKDAAFVYLLTKDRKYFDAVKKELFAQIQISAVDASKWAWIHDVGRWVSAEWITRLLFAYDYIKDDLSLSERSQLDQWFSKAGHYFKENVHRDLVKVFPNRQNEDYSVKGVGYGAHTGKMIDQYTHVNSNGTPGNKISELSLYYNNRRSAMLRTVGLIGAFLQDKELLHHSKIYLKEMLMFSTYPDGTMGEYQRNSTNPQQGMLYSAVNISFANEMADVLARKGDFELYNYSTSEGLHGTAGGQKSIKMLVENFYKQTDLSIQRYHKFVDIRNRIDSENEFTGERWVHDIYFTMSNVYWKNDYYRKAYMRQVGPPYPQKVSGAGPLAPWGGPGGSYPGILFMFGQMEGKVWPYPTASTTPVTGSVNAPSSLSATSVSSNEIKLNWIDNSNNESVFIVEVSNSSTGGFTALKEVAANTTSFSHTGLTSGTTKYYRVLAKSSTATSGYSNVVNATTSNGVPTSPTQLSSKAVSSSQINIYWLDNSNNETAFTIEVSSNSTSGFTLLKEVSANSTSYNHTGLQPGTTRYYRVHAKNGSGNSGYSNVSYSTTTTSVPATPTQLTAKGVSGSQIDITWSDNCTSETAFVVEVSSNSTSGFTMLKEVTANSTSFSHTGLQPGALRYYRVYSKNAAGISSYSNVANATTTINVPTAPTQLTAKSVSTSQINISWIDNSVNESAYVIEVSSNSSSGFTVLKEVAANSTSFSHTGLQPGMIRYYRVYAKNAAGNSSYSNVANATTTVNIPTSPTQLTSKTISSSQINIYWLDNSNNETAFVIEVSNNSTTGFALLKEVAANSTSFSHSGLQPTTTKYYRVYAKNASGKSGFSNIAYATTSSNAPTTPTASTAPSNISANAISTDQIEVKWLDNSNNETKFVVEYSFSENGNFTVLAEVNANTTKYVHSNLYPNQKIYYRVKSENSIGSSNYTPVVSAITKCPVVKPELTIYGNQSFCEGEEVVLISPSGYVGYEWNDGQTTDRITVSESGLYSVKVKDHYGCWSSYSETVTITAHAAPKVPEIKVEQDSLFTGVNLEHQWILNNKPILGASSNFYIPIKAGEYSVVVKDKNGCAAQSSTIDVTQVRSRIVKVFPNPNQGTFKVEIDNPMNLEYEMIVYSTINETILQKRLVNLNDRKILDEVDVRQYGKGIFLVKIHHPSLEPIVEKVLVR